MPAVRLNSARGCGMAESFPRGEQLHCEPNPGILAGMQHAEVAEKATEYFGPTGGCGGRLAEGKPEQGETLVTPSRISKLPTQENHYPLQSFGPTNEMDIRPRGSEQSGL